MIITHLAVEGVARFRSRHVVRGLGPGLNLLCAPNEAGKSTLFRALQAALFARHGSNTEELRRLGCLGAQLPASVEVGFRRGGADYRVEKTFLRNSAARLFKDTQLVAEGRHADEAIWSALDLAPGVSGADESTFGLLWVRQAQSFDVHKPGAETRAQLARVIEQEVGEVLGGERGERVLKRVTEALAPEETSAGKMKAGGAWKQAADRVAAATAALAELRRMQEVLEADHAALAAKLKDLETLRDPTVVAEMRAELAAAERERDAGLAAEQAAQQAETVQAQRELAAERARKRHEDALALDQRIGRTREQIAALERRLAAQSAAHATQTAALASLELELARRAEQSAAAEQAVEVLRRREAAARDAERVRELSERLTRARELRDRLGRLRQSIVAINVAPDLIRRIEAAVQAVEAAQARRDARAARIVITLGPAGAGQVACDGEPVTGTREIAATAPLAITVGDLATIAVEPAAAPDDATAVEDARAALAALLRGAGLASLAEAHERRARAIDLTTEGRGLAAELDMLAPANGREDGLAALEQALAAAQAGLDALGGDGAGAAPAVLPDRDTLARERAAAEAQRDALRRQSTEAHNAVLNARTEAAAEKVRLEALRVKIAEAQSQLADDLALSPDDRRAERLIEVAAAAGEARALFETAQAAARRSRAAVPTAEQRGAVAARVKRLAQAIKGNEERLGEIERDIAGLQGRIVTRGGEGLGERAAEAADALALAEGDLARIERRVAALRLLRDTIEASRRAASDSFLAPVKTAMRPYLHTLFPGADAALDDQFAIGGLQRSGPEMEPIDLLSLGTKEQIAIIVRLGLGRLLAERGSAVPIVLDDSLVFSDDDRIERMFDVLTQAAEKQQVIVLTCRSRAFLRCGGRQLTIEPDQR